MLNAWHRNIIAPIDTTAEANVLSVVAKVQDPNNPMTDATATPVDAHYTKLDIALRTQGEYYTTLTGGNFWGPAIELLLGQSISLNVEMGFTDPYHLYDQISDPILKDITNRASVSANIVLEDGTRVPIKQPIAATYELRPLEKYILMTKGTWQFQGQQIGMGVRYPIYLYLSNAGLYQSFTNPVIVDYLPEGLTVNETDPIQNISGGLRTSGLIKEVTLVSNYLSSGRRALMIKLNDFVTADLAVKDLNWEIRGVTNNLATPQQSTDARENNMNRIFFTADELRDGMPLGVELRYGILDRYDTDRDGDSAERIVGAESTMLVLMPEAVLGVKSIREHETDPWSSYPIYTKHGATFQYKISSVNNAEAPLTGLYIYDRLPYQGDLDYLYIDGVFAPRESAFRPVMTGPVINPDPAKYTITYRTDDYIPQDAAEAQSNTRFWLTDTQVSDWSQVKAISIVLNEGFTLEGYHTADFIVNMKAPEYVEGEYYNGLTANNNFAVSYDGDNWGRSNTVSDGLFYFIPVSKTWSGGDPQKREPVTVTLMSREVDVGLPYTPVRDELGNPLTKVLGPNADPNLDWKDVFAELPVISENGVYLEYTVIEDPVVNHETLITGNFHDGFVLQNAYKSPNILIVGEKTWKDGPSASNAVIFMQLYRRLLTPDDPQNNPWEAVGLPHRLAENLTDPVWNWRTQRQNAQFDQDGREYEFEVREVITPETVWPDGTTEENYQRVMVSQRHTDDLGNTAGWTFTLTNQYIPPRGDITAYKEWLNGGANKPVVVFDLYRYRPSLGETAQTAEAVMEKDAQGVDTAIQMHQAVSQHTGYQANFVDLPLTDINGVPYVYRVEERTPEQLALLTDAEKTALGITDESIARLMNYTPRHIKTDVDETDDLRILNTYQSPMTTVTANKTWLNVPQNQNTPEIKLLLLQNGRRYDNPEVTNPVTLTNGVLQATWTVPLTDLYEETYNYNVLEVTAPANYVVSYDDPVVDDNGAVTQAVTNEYVPDSLIVRFIKNWGPLGPSTRPNVQMRVYRYDQEDNLVSTTVNTMHDLSPETDTVTSVTYRWNMPESYVKDGVTYNYKYVIEETQVDQVPVEEVTIDGATVLMAGDYLVEKGTQFEDVSGSVRRINRDFTNTYVVPKGDILVTKVWRNAANPPVVIPPVDDVQITLMRRVEGGAEETLETVTLSKDAVPYEVLWTDFPLSNDLGQPYTYFIEESGAPLHYAMTQGEPVWDAEAARMTIPVSNDYQVPYGEFKLIKVWEGGPAEKPDVYMYLRREGTVTQMGAQISTPAGETTASHILAEKYPLTDVDGKPHTFYAAENVAPRNYVTTPSEMVTFDPANPLPMYEFTVKNTFVIPKGRIELTKIWDGGPEQKPGVSFQLYRTLGTLTEPVQEQKSLISGTEAVVWTDVELTDNENNPYVFSVTETMSATDYELTAITGDHLKGFVATNRYIGVPRDIEVTKVWQGEPGEPPETKLALYQNGKLFEMEGLTNPVSVNAGTGWKAVFKGVPTFDRNGQTYTYTVDEPEIPEGYVKTVDQATFTVINRYSPLSVKLTAMKELTGNGAALGEGQFAFRLFDTKGVLLDEQKNLGDGSVEFPEQFLTKPGTYVYNVKELNDALPGITYDRSLYTVVLDVLRDESGNLSAEYAFIKDGETFTGPDADFLEFVNSRFATATPTPDPTPRPTSGPQYPTIYVDLDAEKVLRNKNLRAGDFEFILKDRAGNELERVKNAADGSIDFTARRFSRPGTFIYEITEVKGSEKKVRYDDTIYTARVVVTLSEGRLTSTVEVLKDGVPHAGNFVFTNVYDPPKTGDNTMNTILTLLLSAVLMATMVIVLNRKKKTN